MDSRIGYALGLLPPGIREAVESFGEQDAVDEIRLRAGRKISLSVKNANVFLDKISAPQDLESVFKAAFSYSLHSYKRELSQGSVTTLGGNRVGIAGTAVTDGNSVETVRNITSINIRIAREIKGCADGIAKRCFSSGAESLIVIGPPSSGKTTLLRDVCRTLGAFERISVIDEKGELSASHDGLPQNDVGALSDIFFCYPKAAGIETAVRVMSPRAVVVDEIGSEEDADALLFALHSGVKLITAFHAESISEARAKPAINRLFREKAFRFAAVLDRGRRAEVEEIV